jgi:hypothetical protein
LDPLFYAFYGMQLFGVHHLRILSSSFAILLTSLPICNNLPLTGLREPTQSTHTRPPICLGAVRRLTLSSLARCGSPLPSAQACHEKDRARQGNGLPFASGLLSCLALPHLSCLFLSAPARPLAVHLRLKIDGYLPVDGFGYVARRDGSLRWRVYSTQQKITGQGLHAR